MAAATASARASASAPAKPARRQAPATPRRAPARRSPARRRPAQRRAAAPAIGLIPSAVNRVGELADCGLMVRMTRSRAWIGVLAALLAGIVTLNVASLSYTSSSGRVAARSEALQHQNALLRAKLTEDLSGPRVERVAVANGLLVPEPHAIEYLSAGDQYAKVAARRLRDGLLTASSDVPPEVAPAPVEPVAPPVVPEVPAATEVPPPPAPLTP